MFQGSYWFESDMSSAFGVFVLNSLLLRTELWAHSICKTTVQHAEKNEKAQEPLSDSSEGLLCECLLNLFSHIMISSVVVGGLYLKSINHAN